MTFSRHLEKKFKTMNDGQSSDLSFPLFDVYMPMDPFGGDLGFGETTQTLTLLSLVSIREQNVS